MTGKRLRILPIWEIHLLLTGKHFVALLPYQGQVRQTSLSARIVSTL
jgi:hypothetical protein